MRRTQLYLDESQYRWLKQRAGHAGSIAQVVRALIDEARADRPDPSADTFVQYLLEASAGEGARPTSVTTLDEDLYA